MLPRYPRLHQQALVIGKTHYLVLPIAYLLARAGFDVHILFNGSHLHFKKIQAKVNCVLDDHIFTSMIEECQKQNFDIIILADDLTIAHILRSDLSSLTKQKVLPVVSANYWGHLCSKNGLAQYLHNSQILQPSFMIANSVTELEYKAQSLGFPLLLKINFSGGGTGVYECINLEQVLKAPLPPNSFPLLLQKKISGPVIDLSGFFYQGRLVHFSYAKFLSVKGRVFSPSVLRQYRNRDLIDPQIQVELSELGRVLGLNGFVNISCIHSLNDDLRYYFEADVRPNAWVNFPYYLGDDPAREIHEFFQYGKTVLDLKINRNLVECLEIPYISRMPFLAIMRNQYGVWKYCKEYTAIEIIQYCIGLGKDTLFIKIDQCKNSCKNLVKWIYHRPIYFAESIFMHRLKPHLPKEWVARAGALYKSFRRVDRK